MARGAPVFDDLLSFPLFTFAADHERGTPEREAMPSHLSMSFDDAGNVPDQVRAELVASGWDESLGVWPYPVAYEHGSGIRRCTRDELHALSAAPEPGTSLVVHLKTHGEHDWLVSRAAYPAPDLAGARAQDSFGDAPPIAYVAREYLEHRATKVQATTLNRDLAVLERILASIEQVCTQRGSDNFLLGALELRIEEIIAGQEVARQLVKRMLQLSAEKDLSLSIACPLADA